MKKVSLFLLAFVLVLGYSCGDSADSSIEDTMGDVVEGVEETAGDVVEEVEEVVEDVTSTDLPTFDSAEANEFIASYDAFANKTIEMLSTGDFEGVAAMQEEGTALATSSAEMMSTLSAEDATKMTEYMTAKSEEMAAAAGM